jgi:GNAT superfamily N-acetyltransferase
MREIEIRPARAADAPAISALVRDVFAGFVAPRYGAEGRATFEREAAPQALAARLAEPPDSGRTALVACTLEGGEPVGYLEVEKRHIRELFVAGPYQRRGIARALLARAFEGRQAAEVTVNAAPNSLEAYAGLGFEPAGPWIDRDGITFRPMVRRAGRASS